jgi:hypothetical protein
MARQLGDVPAIADRTDELFVQPFARVGALRGRGQTQAEWREAHARRRRVRVARQVMALVEDHQAEAIA